MPPATGPVCVLPSVLGCRLQGLTQQGRAAFRAQPGRLPRLEEEEQGGAWGPMGTALQVWPQHRQRPWGGPCEALEAGSGTVKVQAEELRAGPGGRGGHGRGSQPRFPPCDAGASELRVMLWVSQGQPWSLPGPAGHVLWGDSGLGETEAMARRAPGAGRGRASGSPRALLTAVCGRFRPVQ